jgi:hypothetical protein
MLNNVLTIITIVLAFVGYIPYLKDIIFGNTKPHIYSWLVWTILNITLFSIQFNNGAGPISFIYLITGVICTVIMLFGIGDGIRNITKLDGLFLVLSLISLGMWVIAKEPLVSSILIALVNVMALLPTFRKSWFNPFEETLSTYILSTVRTVLTVFLLESHTIITMLSPVVGITITTIFCIFLIIRRKQVG